MTATTLTHLAAREHVNDLLRNAQRNRNGAYMLSLVIGVVGREVRRN